MLYKTVGRFDDSDLICLLKWDDLKTFGRLHVNIILITPNIFEYERIFVNHIPGEVPDLVTFTEEIHNRKLHDCAVCIQNPVSDTSWSFLEK